MTKATRLPLPPRNICLSYVLNTQLRKRTVCRLCVCIAALQVNSLARLLYHKRKEKSMGWKGLERNKLDYLLTDMLPVEVSELFSFSQFYSFLLNKSNQKRLNSVVELIKKNKAEALKKLFDQGWGTKPLKYNILKGSNSYREMSVINPMSALNVFLFIEVYQKEILDYFEKEHCFSIRYHKKNTALYYKTKNGKYTDYFQKQINTVNRNFIQQTGSYYKISPFESINSFAGSRLWRMCNFKYKMCAKVDYKSCFDSIYTHSYAWIIERNIIDSKDAKNSHLFLTIDRILQNINGRSSNGIIVGPEFSRMIAEILLQRIDVEVMTSLSNQGLIYNQHYIAFRYVDDIFLFADEQNTVDAFIQTLRQCANKYLLHLNELKLTTDKTPWLPKEWLDKVRVLSDTISNWFYQGKKSEFDKLEEDKRFLVKSEYASIDRLKDEIAVLIKNHNDDKRTVVSFLLSTLLNNISKKKDGYTLFGKNQSGRAFLLIDMALYIYAFYPSFDQTRKIISIISYIDKELNFKSDINTKKKLKNTLERYSFIFQSGNLPDLCDWLPLLVEYEIYFDTDTEKYWMETAKKENNPIILANLLLYTKYNERLFDAFLREIDDILVDQIDKISIKEALMHEEFWYVLVFHNCPYISIPTKDLIKKLISDVKAFGGTTIDPSREMKNLLCEFLEVESSLGNKPDNSFFNWKGTRDFGNIVTYRTYQRTVFKKYRKNTHALYASLD